MAVAPDVRPARRSSPSYWPKRCARATRCSRRCLVPPRSSSPRPTTALQPAQADVVNYCLRQVVERGTGTGARFGVPGQIAGKTGTTDDYGDAWFVGYTSKLTTAVWMGWADGSSRKMTNIRGRKVNGGSY